MATFLVQKTFYLSTVVEASTWDEAQDIADEQDFATWDYEDSETSTVKAIDD